MADSTGGFYPQVVLLLWDLWQVSTFGGETWKRKPIYLMAARKQSEREEGAEVSILLEDYGLFESLPPSDLTFRGLLLLKYSTFSQEFHRLATNPTRHRILGDV